ncbi:MAG: D-aminoacylase [Bacillota bacterium]|nr:D-aminoacylase [Bacillota bacterium]
MFDLVITGGRVLDGSGNPWYWADVGVKDGRIAAIARVQPGASSPLAGKAPVAVDARGKVVTPGFIDTHSHSDLPLLVNPTADSKIAQGITTEVIGQCGSTLAPLTDKSLALYRGAMRGPLADAVDWSWRSFGQYLDRMEKQGTSVNVAGLVGHGPVRVAGMGFDQRPPTADELRVMCGLVRGSVEEGAFGFSTGLIYTPCSYSELPELVALARAAAKVGGIYFTHMRSEGEGLLAAVAESLAVGRQGGLPVHIAHLKASGVSQGKGPELIAALEAARAEGIDVTADQYPYTAGSTGLAAMLPPWAHEGGREKMVARLKDPAERARIRKDMGGSLPGWDNDFRAVPWTHVLISGCSDTRYQGRRMQEIADDQGQDPYTALFDLLADVDPGTGMIVFMMREDDVKLMMTHDLVCVGTDGSAIRPDGPLGQGKPHPRAYGTFPRVLGHYVREQRVLTLQQAVRKMTSAGANRLGITDRGQIREGWWADMVVLNPDTVIDRATYENPHQFPDGIDHVLVNGQVVISEGKHTGKLAGKVLRHRR